MNRSCYLYFSLAVALVLQTPYCTGQFANLLNFSSTSESYPYSGTLITDGSVFYGTVGEGESGSTYRGAIYKMNMDGSGYTVLKKYHEDFIGTYGYWPWAPPTLSGSTLYGTTRTGGSNEFGTLYKLNTDGSGFSVLHHFGSIAYDGRAPRSGPLVLSGSMLYGTTYSGGANNFGTIYRINTDGSGYTVLLSFGYTSGPNYGAFPTGLTLSGDYLYGITSQGGPNNGGVVFRYTISSGTYTMLTEFSDGTPSTFYDASPPVVSGSTLYGINPNWCYTPWRWGYIFQMDTDGNNFAILKRFYDANYLTDGYGVTGTLALYGSFLFGYTYQGGSNNYGTLFQISVNSPYNFTKLLDFTGTGGNYPGDRPQYNAPLIFGSVLYATTQYGGTNNRGNIFRYVITPYIQAADITFSAVTSTQFTAGWTNGGGSRRAVFVAATGSGSVSPAAGTTYTPDPVFGNGTQVGSSGWYCVYNNTGQGVTVTGLTPNTQYRVMVCEYAGPSGSEQYQTGTTTNNPANQTTYKVWTGATTDWNSGSNWSGGAVPIGSDNLEITSSPGNQPHVTTDPGIPAVCNHLLISSGAVLTIDAGKALSVNGTLTNNAGTGGIVIKSDAVNGNGSLIESSGVQGTVERYINNTNQWHFLSSPVSGQDIWPQFAPEPAGNPLTFGEGPWNWDFYYFNPNSPAGGKCWVNLRKTDGTYNDGVVNEAGNNAGYGSSTPPEFTTGQGYLTGFTTGWGTTHTFSGNLNSGSVPVSVINNNYSYNLVGNPYPSSIDWKAGTGWDRSSLAVYDGGYVYWIWNDNNGNYGVFNSFYSTGSHGTSQYIAPGQGFFVNATSTGTVSMTGSVRAHSSQSWLKETAGQANQLRIFLSTSANSWFDEMILGIEPLSQGQGTPKFWSMYSEAPEIYALRDGSCFSIELLRSISEGAEVNLGIKAGINGDYTLAVNGLESFNAARKLILEDLKTGTSLDLKESNAYSFSAGPGDPANRFRLRFGGTYGTDGQSLEKCVNISAWQDHIIVHTCGAYIRVQGLVVYDLAGRKLLNRETAEGITRIHMHDAKGYYLVNLCTEQGIYRGKVFLGN